MDDNADMVATMRDVLELEGATVRTATSSAEAEEILARGFQPSVVVVDVRLGGGEAGDAFARRLQADPRHAAVPVVLMSGDVHELRRLGGVGGVGGATLAKPFDVEHLLALLSEMCADPPAPGAA